MKLVQLTNTWELGGTTMCALAVAKALPDWEHEIIAPPNPRVPLPRGVRLVDRYPFDADVLVLHNIGRGRVPSLPTVPTIQFHHSRAELAPADVDLYASDWLRDGRPGWTCYQSVDRCDADARDALFRVGRLTNPTQAKWGATVERVFRDVASLGLVIKRETCGGRVDGAVELPLSPHAARDYLPRWHVLLYHSPVTESFGRVVVEAMAAGCVPLVDPRGGPAETVIGGVTGFHCSGPQGFRQRVEQLFGDRELWRRMSHAARAWVRYQFSHEAFRYRLLQAIGHARQTFRARFLLP